MAPSTSPLRLQVIDRIYAVLAAIVTGDNYYFTTGTLAKKWIGEPDKMASPAYGVFTLDGEAPEEINGEYEEEFTVIVKGIVTDMDDPMTAVEQAIHDVRRAIDIDGRDNTTTGALGTLTVYARIGRADVGAVDKETGLGIFTQEIIVKVVGPPFSA